MSKDILNQKFEAKRDANPDPESYQKVVDAFYMGMTAIEMALASAPQDVVFSLFERPRISSEAGMIFEETSILTDHSR